MRGEGDYWRDYGIWIDLSIDQAVFDLDSVIDIDKSI